MKNKVSIWVGFLVCIQFGAVCAQQAESADSSKASSWEFSVDANSYLMKEDFMLLPVVRADKGALHLEARYNYEAEETFSVWGGYNISGGNDFEYLFTPMAGVVVGEIDGIAPGLEMTLSYKGFELYSESEYYFDSDLRENNYFYNWSDLTWSPLDWLWIGVSGQRTRVYQTDVEIQRGLLIGGGSRNWELSTYLYNPVSPEDKFFIFALSISF